MSDKLQKLKQSLGIPKTQPFGEGLTDALIDELQAAIPLIDYAKAEAERWMQARGLSVSEGSTYKCEWDPEHNELIYSVAIANPDVKALAPSKILKSKHELHEGTDIYSQADGCTLKIRIPTSETKNYATANDLLLRCESLWRDVAADLQIINSKVIQMAFRTDQNVEMKSALDRLKMELQKIMNIPDMEQIDFAAVNKVIGEFIKTLANNVAKTRDPNNPDLSYKNISKIIKEIEDQEHVFVSNINRDVLFSANAMKNGKALLKIIERKSNISSNVRTLVGKLLANWNATTDIALVKASNGSYQEINRIEADRHVSISAHKDDREQLLETMKRMIVINARDELILMINSGKEIPATLHVDKMFKSFLSPAVSNTMLLRLIASRNPTLYKNVTTGNEKDQLRNAQSIMHELENGDTKFEFNQEDLKYIKNHVSTDVTKLEQLLHNPPIIKHENLYFNFPLNRIGVVRAKFPNSSSNKHNQKGLRKLQSKINEYIRDRENIDKSALELIEQYLNKPSQDTLKEINKYIDANLRDTSVKVKNILSNYNDLYMCISGVAHQDPILNNLLGTCYAGMVATDLGYRVDKFCKSAKDRTELQYCAEGAMLFDQTLDPEILLSLIKYGPGAILSGQNCNCNRLPIQVSPNILDKLDPKITQYLRQIHCKEAGKLNNSIYEAARSALATERPGIFNAGVFKYFVNSRNGTKVAPKPLSILGSPKNKNRP